MLRGIVMVKVIFVVSFIVASGLAVLAMIGGCGFADAIAGGAVCTILLATVGLVLYGLIVALRHIGAIVSAGIVGFLVLFWHKVLPAVCVQVISHILGVDN
jgi:hypothetical protein